MDTTSNHDDTKLHAITGMDAYRRDAHEAAQDESLKAAKRFINAAILTCEAQAQQALDGGTNPLHRETWAMYTGKAEGLRIALRALNTP